MALTALHNLILPRAEELFVYLRQAVLRYPLPPQRFAIFSHPRSGSQLLRGLLSQHSEVFCDGEIYLKFLRTRFSRVLFPYGYLRAMACRAGKPVYGCLLREVQLHRVCSDSRRFTYELWERGWKILYLQRQNALRQTLSHLRALRSGVWHVRVDGGADSSRGAPALVIPPQAVLDALLWLDQVRRYEEKNIEQVPHLRLDYESDLDSPENHQATADRVFAYLGLAAVPVRARHAKTGDPRLWEGIANGAEIEEAIRATPYARFLSS